MRKNVLSFILIILGISLFIQNNNIQSDELIYKNIKSDYIQTKANYVFNYINNKNIEASQQAGDLKRIIRSQLMNRYDGDLDKIKEDLLHIYNQDTVNTEVIQIIGNAIKDVSLNNVSKDKADNNNPVIFLKNQIIGDLSLNCSTKTKDRTIKTEIKNQFAVQLAYTAMMDITAYGKEYTYWHFLQVDKSSKWYDEVKNTSIVSLKKLKEMFIKYDGNMEFLQGFEFLATARIDEDKDINGEPILSCQGVRNDKAMQLHIVQGYNLIDQLELNLVDYDYINNLTILINNLEYSHIKQKMHDQTSMIIMIALFLLMFVYLEKKE